MASLLPGQAEAESAARADKRNEYYQGRIARQQTADYHARLSTGIGLLKILPALLLFIVVIRYLSSNGAISDISFTDLLRQLASTPTISTEWISVLHTELSLSFPSWLSWLGAVIDAIVSGFQWMMYMSVMMINVVPFIFHFVSWLFIS